MVPSTMWGTYVENYRTSVIRRGYIMTLMWSKWVYWLIVVNCGYLDITAMSVIRRL